MNVYLELSNLTEEVTSLYEEQDEADIIAATLEMKGDNTYLHNKGDLNFSVRDPYHVNEKKRC